jgi:hypothetical protein
MDISSDLPVRRAHTTIRRAAIVVTVIGLGFRLRWVGFQKVLEKTATRKLMQSVAAAV